MEKSEFENYIKERYEDQINWIYAVCDAAVRRHVDSNFNKPQGFPYTESAV